ncbi:hypothetical protein [Micropruina glycogenica]|uniref:Colicin import membrane protein n=1 Tax=Micropruina glycogenica TaxID=75385 RepID=A0A2N9JCV5_9ACTN|nr:hypothetical protein [Micropruina glycogenica]SPD85961.1 conserved protein of unknown function [Micropruina glycogenica]
MSTQDSDGIDEALQGVTHVAMTAAARMGEQLARMREEQARDAQARSEQAAREHAARMAAERGAARASLSPVHRPEWWDTATAQDVTKAYTTAKAWSEVDPEAVRAEQRIVEEVRNRYGVDVTGGDEPAAVAEAIARADRARSQAAEERSGASGDRAEAVGLMAAADATDRAAEADARRAEAEARSQDVDPELADAIDAEQAGPVAAAQAEVDRARAQADAEHGRASEMREDAGQSYDSAERRKAMAQGLDHIVNRAAVDARVRSDVAQGRPAADAVTSAPGRAPKARKTKGIPQTARTLQRPSRGRQAGSAWCSARFRKRIGIR